MAKYFNYTDFWQTAENDKITPKCSAIIFKNMGDKAAKINGVWRLEPGEETPTISTGNPEVVDMSTYQVSFDESSGGIAPLVIAILIYTMPITSTAAGPGGDACEKF